jgi:hypothetical protein
MYILRTIKKWQIVFSSCEAPWWRNKSWRIIQIKIAEVPNLPSRYSETKSIRNRTTVDFVFEKVYGKYGKGMSSTINYIKFKIFETES